MDSEHVVMAVKSCRTYGKQAEIVATFKRRIDSEVAERALNEMVNSKWYHGDKLVAYCACPSLQVRSWAESYGIYVLEEQQNGGLEHGN